MAMTRTSPNRSLQRPDERTPDGEERWLATLGGVIWDSIPLLLAIDLLLCVAAIPVLLAMAAGASVLAPLIAAATLGPLWLAAMMAGRRLLAGDVVNVRHYLAFIRQQARPGIGLALIPAGALTLLLGTVRIAGAYPEQRWLVCPLLLNGSLAMLALLAGSWAFPLATRSEARGRALWRLAVVATGTAPVASLGTVALLVFIWLGWRFIGPLVPVVLAAPFALYLAALAGWWRRWVQRKMDGTAHG